MSRQVFDEIKDLTTEGVHPGSMDLDVSSIREILEFMNDEDATVARAVRLVLPEVEKAVSCVLKSFRTGGRLIFVGAGTSGRLGILEAAECPPTFGSDPSQVVGLIAGGDDAVFRAQEGSEDRRDQAHLDLEKIGLQEKDTVVGVTASRRTPYVLGALDYARSVGAATIFLICNSPLAGKNLEELADLIIAPLLGPEVVMGSTRLKAATATKMILNMITTAAFVRSGKVYRGLMVDLRAGSEKLRARAHRVLMLAAAVDYETAGRLLEQAEGSVKTAIIMAKCGVDREKAREKLEQAGGFVRRALGK